MSRRPTAPDIAQHVWQQRYRAGTDGGEPEPDIAATWQRVARACAAVEGAESDQWQAEYLAALQDFRFLPAGRILAGAGTGARVTLCNCFVMGRIEDSLAGICRALEESALTMQQGGGIGLDFSTLRPRGSAAGTVARTASGPVSFMQVWAAMCDTLTSTAGRGGAMMATLRCDHPDILEFIDAKRTPGNLSSFNLSVLVSDAFMAAVQEDRAWPLLFPAEAQTDSAATIVRTWPGHEQPVACRVYGELPARELWARIVHAAYESAEPGVIFTDTVNRENNLSYCEQISTTNPCGEEPLPPYGACNLGSINLVPFVTRAFAQDAAIDLDGIGSLTRTAVRLLDAVLDVSHYPLPAQQQTAQRSRRVGLGITGLADALMLLNLHYDSKAARSLAANVMQTICHAAYEASIELAIEKGPFPAFDADAYLRSPFIQRLPKPIRENIARHGIRNSHLLAIAPTGSISLLAGVSTGIEPVFDLAYQQRVRTETDETVTFKVQSHALSRWRALRGDEALPASFVIATELPVRAHLAMQATLQRHVDGAISKTINLPSDCPLEAVDEVYRQAHELGLKGCTVYRPRDSAGQPPLSSAGIECGRCGPSEQRPAASLT